MRKSITRILAGMCILLSGSFSGNAHANGTVDGLAAYYPFNGNADDESGNGHHGDVHGAILTEDRFGNPDSAFQFDGLNDYISTADHPDFTVTDVSVAAWIKTTDKSDYAHITSCYEKNNSAAEWYDLKLTAGSGTARWQVDPGYVTPPIVIGNTDVADGEWHFLVGVRDTSSTQLLIYVDGDLEAVMPDVSVDELDPAGEFWIGAQRGFSSRYLDGVIDDVQVYNRALSSSEIMHLYTYIPEIPFTEFHPSTTHVNFGGKDKTDHFFFAGNFLLDEQTDGINLLEENVTLRAGPFSTEIQAGSFIERQGFYIWRGNSNDVRIKAIFMQFSELHYSFFIQAHNVDLTGWSNPEEWRLGIGNDIGKTTQWLKGHLHKDQEK